MAKSIIINKEQERIILEHIERETKYNSISDTLKNGIKDGTTPLSNLPISKNLSNKIIEDILMRGYDEAVKNFNDDITKVPVEKVAEKLGKLIRICQKKEERIHTELEKLCVDVALSYFTDEELQDVTLECRLVNDISKQDFHVEPNLLDYEYDDISNYESTELEITHRKLSNILAMGGALRLYDKLQEYFIPELFKLDEDLPHLYSKILKINNYLLYVSQEEISDKNTMQSGCVNVTLDTARGDLIVAVGTIFPFLLVETLRGFIELMSDKSLPDNQSYANKILDGADILKDEPWYMIIGGQLWDTISDEKSNYTQQILRDFFNMEKGEFVNFMCELLANTKKGKEELGNYIQKSKYNTDYSDFEKDLAKKREENHLITDGVTLCESVNLSEDLDEATYPESFNMDEFKKLNSFAARVRYCSQRLPKLGSGSARIVFLIDNDTVLKLAKNEKGVAQNEAEARVKHDYYLNNLDLFAEVYDVDENYLWIEMQFAKRATKKDVKRLTGYDFETLSYWMRECWNNSVAIYGFKRPIPEKYKMFFNSKEFKSNYKGTIFSVLEDYIGNYHVQGVGDLQRISSWGVAKYPDGGENLVIIDNGLSNEVLNKYYSE